MNEDNKKMLMIGGAIVVLLLAAVLIFRQATAPKETINDINKIPRKGIRSMSKGDD